MKAKLQVRIESHPFSTGDLIGGDAALDFINTVTGRDQSPRDWLDSYTRLLEWAALVHLLPEKILRALARKTQSEPTAAATALARAKKLRETLFALVTGIVSGSAPPKTTLALLRQHRKRPCGRCASNHLDKIAPPHSTPDAQELPSYWQKPPASRVSMVISKRSASSDSSGWYSPRLIRRKYSVSSSYVRQ